MDIALKLNYRIAVPRPHGPGPPKKNSPGIQLVYSREYLHLPHRLSRHPLSHVLRLYLVNCLYLVN